MRGRRPTRPRWNISAWAAILFAPTLIGTVYGMNFEHMPELGWAHGYAFAILLMVLVCVGLYGVFKRRNWLLGAATNPTLVRSAQRLLG